MKSAFFIFLTLCGSLFAGTPTEAFQAFQLAAQGQKFEDAWKHTAQFEGASEAITNYLKSRVERILKLSADGWKLDLLEEKINGDCAAIIANEIKTKGQTALNLDPVFMIKQGEHWRVMPSFTHWDISSHIPADKQPASMKLDERKVAAFNELEKWVEERTKVLQEKQRKQ